MRKLVLAVVMLVATGTSAMAGGSIKDAPIVVAPTWEGAYVGIQVGGAWADWGYSNGISDVGVFVPPGVPLGGFDGEGFTGGIHAGYNRQTGSFVYGLEVDVSWSNADVSRDFVAGILPFTLKSSLESYGTVRARAGYARERMLVYATGGFAWGATKLSVSSPGALAGPFSTDDTTVHIGWTAGAGMEWLMSSQWTLGVEYKHIDLGSETLALQFPLGTVTTSTELVIDEVTLRLSRKF